MRDLKIEAFDDDPVVDADDLLGQKETDAYGCYKINFADSVHRDFRESLEGTPGLKRPDGGSWGLQVNNAISSEGSLIDEKVATIQASLVPLESVLREQRLKV